MDNLATALKLDDLDKQSDVKLSDTERRIKALRTLYDLKFTFQMDDLASDFLRAYIARNGQVDFLTARTA